MTITNTPVRPVEVMGDAMAPLLQKNDIVFIDLSANPEGNGKDVAMLKIGDDLTICRFTTYEGVTTLKYDNAPDSFVLTRHVKVVGKVINIKRNLENNKNDLAGTRSLSMLKL